MGRGMSGVRGRRLLQTPGTHCNAMQQSCKVCKWHDICTLTGGRPHKAQAQCADPGAHGRQPDLHPQLRLKIQVCKVRGARWAISRRGKQRRWLCCSTHRAPGGRKNRTQHKPLTSHAWDRAALHEHNATGWKCNTSHPPDTMTGILMRQRSEPTSTSSSMRAPPV